MALLEKAFFDHLLLLPYHHIINTLWIDSMKKKTDFNDTKISFTVKLNQNDKITDGHQCMDTSL